MSSSLLRRGGRDALPTYGVMTFLACVIGVLAGYGAVLFNWLIRTMTAWTTAPALQTAAEYPLATPLVVAVPAVGLLLVAWVTRRFAPEAQGHGVPEVIGAIARHDGVIRPRVSLVKILASAICIGTGGSVGREGPIVQIGSSLGSSAGQLFRLTAPNIKVLVACGAAAGISATFNAPLAGVMFASEIILGSFAVQSLTPIVISSVLANVVQEQFGEHGLLPIFRQLQYEYLGEPEQLPAYFALGLICGIAAVGFTKLVYVLEDVAEAWLRKWWLRALVAGSLVGLVGVCYPPVPGDPVPPVFGVGYPTVDHALHLENARRPTTVDAEIARTTDNQMVVLDRDAMVAKLWWLVPLVFLKPLLTSITLAGGGSGGIFAPSLFLGATLGASFGLVMNLLLPAVSMHPGVYAVVGMGAVVAGTTHGLISAMLVVYEMTDDYRIILPIMISAGLSSVVAIWIDSESIYHKKLSRRGESIARGHHIAGLEHIMVRDLMLRNFPTVRPMDSVTDIIRVARQNPDFESLPVLEASGQLVGIIRPEDLRRILDSDITPHLVRATDIAHRAPVAVSPDDNVLEALRDFGTRGVETLPVENGDEGESQRLVGLLLRSDVMRCYREELLRWQPG